MNITLPVDSAVIVPINTVPLVDDTDYKTIEDALTYNQAGLDLVWNFLTTAGVLTQTAVTPTESAGDYDWQNKGNGMYGIEIPASGGVSINNDTEGYGWFTGYATGVLPWRGPTISFVPANVVDALVAGSDYLQIDVLQVKGSGTYGTNLYNACANYSATRGLAGTALPDAAADAAGGLPISDAGGLDLDAILADTNELQTNQGNWLTATGFSTHSAADVVTALGTGSTLTDCATATGFSTLDAAGVRSAIGMAAANLDLKFMAITTHITNTTQDVNVTTIGGETVTAAGGIVVGAYVGQAAVGPTKSEMDSAFTTLKGATWSADTDTIEDIRNQVGDLYHADIQVAIDGTNSQDEYTVAWFKNGVRITSGITVPQLQVVKRADGTDLIAATDLTEIGSTHTWKYDESSDRLTNGEAALAIVTATIDGSSREFAKVVGRDSSA